MRLVVGSTLALILVNGSVGRGQELFTPQQQYDRSLQLERDWQAEHERHLERQERQQEEQFRWQHERTDHDASGVGHRSEDDTEDE